MADDDDYISEEDLDYVPEVESSDSDDGDAVDLVPEDAVEVDEVKVAETKKKVDDLWSELQKSDADKDEDRGKKRAIEETDPIGSSVAVKKQKVTTVRREITWRHTNHIPHPTRWTVHVYTIHAACKSM